jgi:hypothetical protein
MKSTAATPLEYLKSLPPDRRTALAEVRNVICGKLDMGKSCVRFKKLEDVPLEVVGQTIARVPVKDHIARVKAAISRK